jgi:hypothetical protein
MQILNELNESQKVAVHNMKKYDNYMAGEEGIDYIKLAPGQKDPQ